jgi:hypothetical protein
MAVPISRDGRQGRPQAQADATAAARRIAAGGHRAVFIDIGTRRQPEGRRPRRRDAGALPASAARRRRRDRRGVVRQALHPAAGVR